MSTSVPATLTGPVMLPITGTPALRSFSMRTASKASAAALRDLKMCATPSFMATTGFHLCEEAPIGLAFFFLKAGDTALYPQPPVQEHPAVVIVTMRLVGLHPTAQALFLFGRQPLRELFLYPIIYILLSFHFGVFFYYDGTKGQLG